MEKKRSVGVIIFGLLFIICTLPNILIRFIRLGSISLPYLITPLISVVTGIGILLLKEWGRKLALISAIVVVVVSSAMFFINPEIIFKNTHNLLINIYLLTYFGLVWYFFTRYKVKEQFK